VETPLDNRLVQVASEKMMGQEVKYDAYKLKAMDVIRVLFEQKDTVDYRLTMPHYAESLPFITIQCSRKRAMQFLTKREPLQW
jgi:hypothetical protein